MIKDPRQEMVRRARAAQATRDRFFGRTFRLGMNDCARMTAFHLRKLGYQLTLPAAGAYRSRAKALKLLRERGYASLPEALDGIGLERIAPAAALVGDIIALEAGDDLGALTIAMGNGRVLGFHEQAEGAVIMQPRKPTLAWRVVA